MILPLSERPKTSFQFQRFARPLERGFLPQLGLGGRTQDGSKPVTFSCQCLPFPLFFTRHQRNRPLFSIRRVIYSTGAQSSVNTIVPALGSTWEILAAADAAIRMTKALPS